MIYYAIGGLSVLALIGALQMLAESVAELAAITKQQVNGDLRREARANLWRDAIRTTAAAGSSMAALLTVLGYYAGPWAWLLLSFLLLWVLIVNARARGSL